MHELCRWARFVVRRDKLYCMREPGKYGLPNSDACIMCEMGKYSNASAASSSGTCQYCAAGQYGDVSNSVNGWDLCVNCPADSFSTPGAELGPGDHMQAQSSQSYFLR